MAIVNDDMNEDSINSALLESVNSHVAEGALCPDDLAWADSCLNEDLDASSSEWSSFKDVLLEILSSQSGPVDSAAAGDIALSTIDEDHNFRDYVASLAFGEGSDEDEDFIEDDIGDSESIDISDDDDIFAVAKSRGRARGKGRIENVFRPNYTEDIVNVENNDPGLNLSSTLEESSPEDIFKVWDLGISDQQDELIKQLNTVFAGVPPSQPKPDDSTAWKDMMHVSVDDLISGMGDLSLKQNIK